ncbi:MAG: hypothetical protein OXI04_04470 [Bacteroidota bacterium]|nr:hypothetical protein [Bacteroidota bacterium]
MMVTQFDLDTFIEMEHSHSYLLRSTDPSHAQECAPNGAVAWTGAHRMTEQVLYFPTGDRICNDGIGTRNGLG